MRGCLSGKYVINDALARTVNFVFILHKQEGVIIEITKVSNIRPGEYVRISGMMIEGSLTLLSNTTCMVEVTRVEKSTTQRKVSEMLHHSSTGGTYTGVETAHITISCGAAYIISPLM